MASRRSGFTTRASCLLAAGVTAVLCGIVLGETDLIRAGVLAAAIPCAAAFVVHRSRVRVANRRSIDPLHASAGDSVTVNLTVTNRSRLPTGTLMLEDQLPSRLVGRARFVLDSLSGHQAGTVSYRLPDLGRGRYRVGPLRIRLGDPFHMIDLTRSFTATTDFVVAPKVDQLPPVEPPRSDDMGDSAGSHSIGTHGADDASTREYRTGDDLRKIHWRSSARTGALMVRQEERPWRAQSTVLLDLRADAHDADPDPDPGVDPRLTDSLEWAVSAAASIGSRALRAGRDIGLIADPLLPDRIRFATTEQLTAHLATARESTNFDLGPVAGLIRSAARDSALVAILGRLDPTDLRLLADAHPRGGSSPAFAMLLDVESWAGSKYERPADRSPNQSGPANQGWAQAERRRSGADAAAAVLRSAGWRVTVVRQGMSTAQAWQVLLAGFAPTTSVGARR